MFTIREAVGLVLSTNLVQLIWWRWRLERVRMHIARIPTSSPPSRMPGSSETPCERCSDPEFLHDRAGCLVEGCRCLQYEPPAMGESNA
jgi:hypothetical protein